MVTQKDIASKLGVSVSLVSRVLSGKAERMGISADTIQRVMTTAEKFGYVPSAAARILKGASAQTIGVVVFDFADPFFGPIIGAIQRLAHRDAFTLVLVGFEGRQVHEADLLPLKRNRLDGLIVLGGEPVLSWIGPFRDQKIPAVRIGGGLPGEPIHSVFVDNEEGLRLALSHLRERGHKTVGAVAATLLSHRRRFEAFERLARKAGLATSPEWIVFGESRVMTAGEIACRSLFETNGTRLPTSIMASSDLVAMGAMNVMQTEGYNIPKDISVIGFDDIPIARLSNPALTTIRQPMERMVTEAFDVIRKKPQRSDIFKNLSLSPEIVVRESTAKVRKRKS